MQYLKTERRAIMDNCQLPKGYKNTEVGVIPEDWEVKTIGDIFTFYSTSNFSKAEMTTDGEVGCVHYGLIHAIENTRYSLANGTKYYITKEQAKYENIQNGDVIMVDASEDLIGLNKSVEVFGIGNEEYISGLHTFHLRDKNSIFIDTCRGLILNCDAVKKQMLRAAVGMKVFGVSKPQLQRIFVPVPTIEEQTAIATALSDADALINSLSTLIAKKRNIKQGAMQKLLQPKEGWEVKKLGEIAFVNMGQSPLSEYYNSEGIGLPLVQGNADVENRKTIIRFYTSMITKKGKAGDIIMSVRAPVGEIAKATSECCLGRGVCSISFDNEYLYHYLIYFEKSWAKLSTGSTFDSVNSKQVKELEIPIPISKEEQTRIATILSDMDAEIQALETKLEKYRKIKLGMMQNLLTGKIRLIDN